MNTPKVGQWLYSSCSASSYGEILNVGNDGNGSNVIDIRVCDIDDFAYIEYEMDDSSDSNFIVNPPLTTAELPKGVNVILRNVQYKLMTDEYIECNTPGNGCFRCTKLFRLTDKDEGLFNDQ